MGKTFPARSMEKNLCPGDCPCGDSLAAETGVTHRFLEPHILSPKCGPQSARSPKGAHGAQRLDLKVSCLFAYDQIQTHLCWVGGRFRQLQSHHGPKLSLAALCSGKIYLQPKTLQRQRSREQKWDKQQWKHRGQTGRREAGCSRHWSRHSPWRACRRGFCSWNTASYGKETHPSRVKNEEEETVHANHYGDWLQVHSHQPREKGKLKIKISGGKKSGRRWWGSSLLGIWQ